MISVRRGRRTAVPGLEGRDAELHRGHVTGSGRFVVGRRDPPTEQPGRDAVREIRMRLARMYQSGQLKLDELITREYTLDDVAEAYDDMRAGKNIRGISRLRLSVGRRLIAGAERERRHRYVGQDDAPAGCRLRTSPATD